MSSVQSDPGNRVIPGMLAIFSVLVSIYCLTFSGLFTSIDELGLYAQTESMVQAGNRQVPQLEFAAFHNPVGNAEPGFPWIAVPLYWLAQRSHHLDNVHTVMLLNPLIVAAVAALLYATVRRLGYSRQAAILSALAYGLASIAWPYTRTLYREPLVALAWTAALFSFVEWRHGGPRYLVALGIACLAFSVLVKTTAFAAVPVIMLAATANRDQRWRSAAKVFLVIGFALVGALILFQQAYLLRAGKAWSVASLSGLSMKVLFQRFYGQLFSPGKGLIFYMPVSILAIPGWIQMWRRHRSITIVAALTPLAVASAYCMYNAWYGGQSWGPRFLVPTLPFITLPIGALWDRIRNSSLRVLCLLLIGVSVFLQLGVVTADWWPGYRPLFQSGPEPEEGAGLTDLALSPPLVQLQQWGPQHLDLLWLHPTTDGDLRFIARLGLPLAAAFIAAVLVWMLVENRRAPVVTLLLPPLLSISVLLTFGPAATSGYAGMTADEGRELAKWATGVPSEPQVLATVSNEFHIYFFLGFLKGDFVHHWLSPAQTGGFEPILEHQFPWVSLIVDRVHIRPEHSGKELEWWLNEHLYRQDSQWIGGYEAVRYANLDGVNWLWQPSEYQFGESYYVGRYAINDDRIQSGEALGIQLQIRRTGPEPDYHHMFLHLLAPGAEISGHDGPIRYGGTIALPWEEGETLTERRAILIPSDAAPGRYDLVLGFDTPEGSLPAWEGGEPDATPYVTLTQVEIGQ